MTNVDALNKSGNTEKMLELQISNKKEVAKKNHDIDSPRSNQSMGYTKDNQNIQNYNGGNSSLQSIDDNDEFDDQVEFSDLNRKRNIIEGTGSVFTNTNI
jgi:hypothetical protein